MCAPRVLIVAIAWLVAACQPVTEPGLAASPAPGVAGAVMPDGGLPTLPALWEVAAAAAQEWQHGARPVEVEVRLDGDGVWQRAAVRYVAAEAQHLLVVELAGGAVTRERIALSAGGADQPLPAAGVEAVPAVGVGWLEPLELWQAAETAVDDCRLDAVGRVVWTSGAPAGWVDGRWAAMPRWRALLLDREGRGAVVDPVTGAAVSDDPCASVG